MIADATAGAEALGVLFVTLVVLTLAIVAIATTLDRIIR